MSRSDVVILLLVTFVFIGGMIMHYLKKACDRLDQIADQTDPAARRFRF